MMQYLLFPSRRKFATHRATTIEEKTQIGLNQLNSPYLFDKSTKAELIKARKRRSSGST